MTAPFPFPALGRRVLVSEVKKAAALHFGVSVEDIESPLRERKFTHPRQVAMHLATRLTAMNLAQIGRAFGGRDRTTVIHADNMVRQRRAADADLDRDVRALVRRLVQPPAPAIAREVQLALFLGPLFDFAGLVPVHAAPAAAPQPKRKPDMAVTRREQQILDLKDEGLSQAQIAERLDLAPSYVKTVIGSLAASGADPWVANAKLSSQQLLKALQRHHPEMCA